MQGKCKDCGTFRKSLHKHHLKPRSKGGTDKDGVVYICANCHEDRHGGTYANEVSEKSRKRHSRNLRKKWKDPKWRKKMIKIIRKAQKISLQPEHNAKRGKASKRIWSDPNYRALQSKKRKEAWAKLTPKQRKKRVRGMLESPSPTRTDNFAKINKETSHNQRVKNAKKAWKTRRLNLRKRIISS